MEHPENPQTSENLARAKRTRSRKICLSFMERQTFSVCLSGINQRGEDRGGEKKEEEERGKSFTCDQQPH